MTDENHPRNDYPEEESSGDEDEEKSSKSGSESEEEESEADSDTDMCTKSDDSVGYDRSEDPLFDDETSEDYTNVYSDDGRDSEDRKWTYR